jgi:hypothetical protein
MKFTLLSRQGDRLPIPIGITDDLYELTYFLENHPVYRSCVGVLTLPDLSLDDLPRFENGGIKGYAIPKQLRGYELAVYIHKAQQGRPQNSNLNRRGRKKAPNWTRETRPTKQRKIEDDKLREASALRERGCSWSMVGKKLGLKAESIRSALRTRPPEKVTLP